MVGNYVVGKQIGAGSFSTVWHARHRAHGTEVAIKEIVTARLNNKLQDSLKSEIVILQKINHPNIIRLHDMIEVFYYQIQFQNTFMFVLIKELCIFLLRNARIYIRIVA